MPAIGLLQAAVTGCHRVDDLPTDSGSLPGRYFTPAVPAGGAPCGRMAVVAESLRALQVPGTAASECRTARAAV
jgi:hypothetical protein